MKLIFVRHGDPDYAHDSLTVRGRREAELLIPRAAAWKEKEVYVSPLGRAQLTARIAMGLPETGEIPYPTLDWLREFDAVVKKPHQEKEEPIAWDWLPGDWMMEEQHFHREDWVNTPVFLASDVAEKYQNVCTKLDALLAEHGLLRETRSPEIPLYRVEKETTEEVIFFCHFGIAAALLSHLIGASPMVFWHGFCAAPTSVTVVRTEERRQGIASFRISTYGDTSHLYIAGDDPSPHGRFTEVFSDESQRHD